MYILTWFESETCRVGETRVSRWRYRRIDSGSITGIERSTASWGSIRYSESIEITWIIRSNQRPRKSSPCTVNIKFAWDCLSFSFGRSCLDDRRPLMYTLVGIFSECSVTRCMAFHLTLFRGSHDLSKFIGCHRLAHSICESDKLFTRKQMIFNLNLTR